MNKFLLILASLPFLLLNSCQKESKDWGGVKGPAIELSFVDSYSASSGAATKVTSPAEDYEKSISSLVLLAYAKDATGTAAPLIKYVFSENERTNKRAVIPLGSVNPGSELDFYVIANAADKNSDLTSADMSVPTIQAFQDLKEEKSMETYNKGNFELFATEGVNLSGGVSKGFVMSDKRTFTLQESGSGKPTIVEMILNRTVARVDVTATVTPKFAENYQGATLTIKSASIKFEAKQGYIIAKAESMVESIANMSPSNDSLRQNNYSTTQTTQGKFRYYPYPCADRHNKSLEFGTAIGTEIDTIFYDPVKYKHLLLTIAAEFSYEAGVVKTIYYKIPLTGTDKKGAFLRNNLYDVQVNINGLTEQEIKATINMAEWEVAATQTVNIGG